MLELDNNGTHRIWIQVFQIYFLIDDVINYFELDQLMLDIDLYKFSDFDAVVRYRN